MTQALITIVIPFCADLAIVEDELLRNWGNPALPNAPVQDGDALPPRAAHAKQPPSAQPVTAPSVESAAIGAALDKTESVHFMGIHALPGAPDNHLVIELSIDGSPHYVLELIVKALHVQLGRLLNLAEVKHAGDLTAFLLRHRREVGLGWFDVCGLGFQGTPGLSVTRIRREAKLAEDIAAQLSHEGTALQQLEKVRAWLWNDSAQKWAFEPAPLLAPTGAGSTLQAVKNSVVPLLRELLWPIALPPLLAACAVAWVGTLWVVLATVGLVAATELLLLGLFYLRFRELENSDREDSAPGSAEARRAILALEDHVAQNHLIVLTPLKPGALRRFSLRLAFFAIRQAVLHVFPAGKLSDIATIHFARWILLPGTSQLLFLSNYGGSWESYLEDFIVKAHMGLTGVWSNTEGFPKARNLFWDGATRGAEFKQWARRQQRLTRFWYSGYPALSTGRIRSNAAIRAGIANARSEDEAAAWLAEFGAARPQTAPRVDADQIPLLVFGGLPRLHHAKCVLMRFRDAAQAKVWLQEIEPRVGYGEDASRVDALSVGFTASGLARLGVSGERLEDFPVAFQHGSALRARPLGDVGPDAPEHWRWGGTDDNAVDAIALLYAATEQRLTELMKIVAWDALAFRREVSLVSRRAPGETLREWFGFVDGISQPILDGTGRAAKLKRRDQLIAPGEVVLGYVDGSGFTPPTPTLAAREDPAGVLPSVAADGGARDLGRNGTFLVVRQLEQHIEGFDAFVAKSAADPAIRAAAPPGVAVEEWIAAKMVGRWKNGTSLVRHPNAPGPSSEADNDFLYGVEDPDGLQCPLGAHIRRANPRDSFDPKAVDPLKVVNRHRILRVGRSYLDAQAHERGLMFMCLNADIERQFEFIQQTWVRAPSFQGLANELDPLVVRYVENPTGSATTQPTVMTIPTERGPVRLKGFNDFVRVRGSGYFFMPGRQALRFLARVDVAQPLAAE